MAWTGGFSVSICDICESEVVFVPETPESNSFYECTECEKKFDEKEFSGLERTWVGGHENFGEVQ